MSAPAPLHGQTHGLPPGTGCTLRAVGSGGGQKDRERDKRENQIRDFPGGPIVKTLGFQTGGRGLIPDQGTKILHVTRCSQKNNK